MQAGEVDSWLVGCYPVHSTLVTTQTEHQLQTSAGRGGSLAPELASLVATHLAKFAPDCVATKEQAWKSRRIVCTLSVQPMQNLMS